MLMKPPVPELIPAPLEPLIAALRERFNPRSIWLFGSRARGDARSDSDWDIILALDDDVAPEELDPLLGWQIQHEVGIPATILTTTASLLDESWGAVNTLGYDLAREGRLLDFRS